MPTIRLNKLAKDLKLGVNSLVEFLSKKRPTASYNPNSKLTAEEFDLVVKGLGHNLSDADKKSLIESHTKKPDTSRLSTDQIRTESHTHQPNRHSSSVDRQSKSGGIHGSTNNDLSKNDNRLAPRGPKVLGHVDLDSKGNVISAKPSPSSEKSDAKSVLIEGSKVANAVETKPDENLMPKAEEKVAQVPLDTTISKASEDDIKMARGIGTSKTAEDDVVKSSDDVVAESSVNETSKLIQDASPKKEELVTPNLEVKGSSNEEEKKEIPNATLSQSVDTKNVKIDSVSPVSDNTVVINTTEENASVTPVPEPTAKETSKKLASSEPTPSLDTPRAKTIVSKALPKDTSTPSANMSSVESTSDTKTAQESSETKKEDVIRIEAPELAGVKVVGHVDLSKMDIGRGPKRKEKRKRTVVKGGEKVDIEKQAKEQTGGEKRKQNGNQSQKGSSNGSKATDKSRTQGNNNGKSQEAVGRKAKAKKKQNQPAQPQSREVTQEEIQRQIKETMAAIQGRRSGSGNSAKYRRDKREERRRDEELQLQAEMEAGKQLQLTEFVTPNDLAQMMDVPVNSIISLVFNLGMMVSINQRLDKDTIELIVTEYGYEAVFVDLQVADVIEIEEDDEEDLEPRAPIVTVMGHVDHGKTSLLDAIRNTDVISHEAGGITQHVGAYRVTLEDDRSITFLDTPGHEAFTAMRARGAQVTDVVIIVVAADDGVMPQTKEAISHASLAGVPIVFAINKIDKPGANPDRIKEELANLNYLVEDWGGKYQSQEISAKQGIGVRDLLEKVLLEAEVLELKANPNKRALGSVLESTMEQGRGYTTKVLIQDGTLHVGDYMVAGSNYGRVKALFDDRGQNVQSVGPSEPVKVLGLNGATTAGETLNVMDSESEVRDIATRREQLHREQRERTQRMPSLMDLGRRIAEGKAQELNVIIKGDMDGSVEALADSIEKLSTDEIRVNVIYKAVGQITESDVSLASASDAVVIGFQVRPAMGAKRIAEENGVEIRTYSVIYDALDDVRTAMEGMLSPETKERVTASVEVRETFKISKVGTIAGCFVVEGKISRTDRVRVIRQGVVIHTGVLASLKRFKDDAKEVVAGLECGLSIQNYNDLQAGDELEVFQEYEVKRTLD